MKLIQNLKMEQKILLDGTKGVFKMKIAVIGTGYVGLVQGVIMSEFGSEVICVDKSVEKIEKYFIDYVEIYC